MTKQAKAKWLEDNLVYLYGNGGVADYPIIPSQPRNLQVTYDGTPDGEKWVLTWDVPLSDGGDAITNYRFYSSLDGESPEAEPLTATYEVPAPPQPGAYPDGTQFWITAVNSLGESGRSNTVTAEVR